LALGHLPCFVGYHIYLIDILKPEILDLSLLDALKKARGIEEQLSKRYSHLDQLSLRSHLVVSSDVAGEVSVIVKVTNIGETEGS